MKFKEKSGSKKSKKSTVSIVMYVAASIIALLGVALLVDNILLFKNTISQYAAKGYPTAVVMKQLIPSQLLPGIFEPIAVYGGISFILLGIGIINKKISKCLTLLTKTDVLNDTIEKNILEENTVNVEDTEENK